MGKVDWSGKTVPAAEFDECEFFLTEEGVVMRFLHAWEKEHAHPWQEEHIYLSKSSARELANDILTAFPER